jgi:hypothetical protein
VVIIRAARGSPRAHIFSGDSQVKSVHVCAIYFYSDTFLSRRGLHRRVAAIRRRQSIIPANCARETVKIIDLLLLSRLYTKTYFSARDIAHRPRKSFSPENGRFEPRLV